MNNFIDKAIAFVDPKKALERTIARKHIEVLNHGYSRHGANVNKNSMLGWSTSNRPVEDDIESNVEILRERSRDLFMSGGVATGAIKTLRTNVIGPGLKLKPSIDYKYLGLTIDEANDLHEKIKREFDLWADSILCDAQQMNNFYELQQLAFISWAINGDCFTALPLIQRKGMPIDLRVRLIDADLVCNPVITNQYDYKIVNGVEVDDLGAVVAYYICNVHPNAFINKEKKWKRVSKFGENTGRQNIIHIMESERINQRRGIPFLTPVLEDLKQISRYTEAELMSAVINSMYSLFITSENPDAPNELGTRFDGDLEDETGINNDISLGNGTIFRLEPGEDIKEANPNRPFSGFQTFVDAISKRMGSALEIPPEILYKNFTSSYSASRAALLEAWKMFKMRRSWLANDFCQPIYEEFLSEAVAKGRINAPFFFSDPLVRKAYCKCEWIGPSQGMLNPVQETTAAILRVDNGLSSLARETMELGTGDFESNHQQLSMEMEKRRQSGLISLKDKAKNSLEGGENNAEKDID